MSTLNTQRGAWKIDTSFDGEAVHIRPRADLRWHPLDPACWCTPEQQTPEPADGATLPTYVHQAADGRD